jgi:hypothetical protein
LREIKGGQYENDHPRRLDGVDNDRRRARGYIAVAKRCDQRKYKGQLGSP